MKYTTNGDGNFTHAADLGGEASGIFFQDATEVVTFRAYYPHSGDEGIEPGPIAVDTKDQTESLLSVAARPHQQGSECGRKHRRTDLL